MNSYLLVAIACCVLLLPACNNRVDPAAPAALYPVTDTFTGRYTSHLEDAFVAGVWDTAVVVQTYFRHFAADSSVIIQPVFFGREDGGTPAFDTVRDVTILLDVLRVPEDPDVSVRITADSLIVTSRVLLGGSSFTYTFHGRRR